MTQSLSFICFLLFPLSFNYLYISSHMFRKAAHTLWDVTHVFNVPSIGASDWDLQPQFMPGFMLKSAMLVLLRMLPKFRLLLVTLLLQSGNKFIYY